MFDHHSEALHFQKNWQQQLSEAFRSIDQLCSYLHLSPRDISISSIASEYFPLKVPLSFAASMQKSNPNDPLLRQVLPIQDEQLIFPGFNHDPVGDLQAVASTGMLHKYQGRVLLINTGVCAVNCRYCFRRNFPYADLQLSKQQEAAAIQYIRDDPSISEVIFSGGDPLLLSDQRLDEIIQELSTIKHLQRIRVHSRLPIVLPARMTDGLLRVLTSSRLKPVMVVHCNHANEISERVIDCLRRLKNSGITVLNQSVLLKGVNDDASVLCALSETLFNQGVLPYYLHLLDKASGTGHFQVSENDALKLMQKVQATIPGYLVPKLVREESGLPSKTYVY